MRAAVASVIAAIPGQVRKAPDLHRIAGVDTKLSWRLLKVARAANPLTAGPYVPGPANIRSFVRAASRAGVGDDLLADVDSASNEFEKFVVAHAGDRSAFDSMISALTKGENADQANLQHRRAAFRANRHLWGVQATTQVKCSFTDIGDDPTKVNVALVDGYVGLRQLRRDAPLIISCTRVSRDDGSAVPVTRQPIDPHAVSAYGLTLLEDFCSDPTPRLREVRAAAGFVYGELVSNGVGNGGALTCFTGWRANNAAGRYRAPNNMSAITHGAVRVPCEAITICMLMRAGMFGAVVPELAIYSDHMAQLPYPAHTHRMDNLLLPNENVAYLGRGARALSTTEISRLPEMAQYVFDQLGWDGQQFDVFQCRIVYPIMPSTVAVSHDLPEAPRS